MAVIDGFCVYGSNADGTDKKLPLLSPSDWIFLGNTLKAQRKGQAAQEWSQLPVPEDPKGKSEHEAKYKKMLANIDKMPVQYFDIQTFLNDIAGQYSAILLSIQKTLPAGQRASDSHITAMGIEPADWFWIAAELCNLKIVSVGGDEKKPTGEPPAAEAQTVTGSPIPAESDTGSTSVTTPSSGPSTDSTGPSNSPTSLKPETPADST